MSLTNGQRMVAENKVQEREELLAIVISGTRSSYLRSSFKVSLQAQFCRKEEEGKSQASSRIGIRFIQIRSPIVKPSTQTSKRETDVCVCDVMGVGYLMGVCV